MIRIELNSFPNLQQEYWLAVEPKVRMRLGYLQTALEHVLGPKDPQPLVTHQLQLGTVVKKIIKQVLKITLPDDQFEDTSYHGTVLAHRARLQAAGFRLQAILDLVNELLKSGNGKLENLLVCPATDLWKVNRDMIRYPNRLRKKELNLLKLAFDYQAYANVSDEIKFFFRTKNFVNYCPYCNQDPAMYSGSSHGKSARVHQLDHFFDKASYPLLCYSLFNLVPGDWICNAINKHSKPFGDKTHLNPYIDGFGKVMVFEPDFDKAGQPLIKIELVIDPKADVKRRKQLLGSRLKLDDTDKEGNINVFALYRKYNDPHVRLEAGRVHQKFLYNLNNQSSLKDFLNQLPVGQAFDRYKEWYELEIRAPFESKNFNEQRYSKLFRDIHDFVVEQDGQPDNNMIQQLTKKYQ